MSPLLIGLIELVVLMAVFFTLGAMGWPGEPDSCTRRQPNGANNGCYCERFHAGMIKQPINTWSNIGFVVVGLLILTSVGGASAPTPSNPMTAATAYSILYGVLVVFLGPGSMFFHASMTKLGGWLDNLSMNLFISFILVYDITRVLHLGVAAFWVVFLILNVAVGIVTWRVDDSGSKFFIGLIVAVALVEVLLLTAQLGGVERTFAPWLLLTVVAFGVAIPIWWWSQTGRALCRPDSLWQGHGLWHILSAVSAGLIFLYLRTEVLR
jgi:hypothetical protein